MQIVLNGVEREVDPGTFRTACESKGVAFILTEGELFLTGPDDKVKAAQMILDASAELEKAIIDAIGSRAPETFNGLFVIGEERFPNGGRNLLVSKTPDGPGLYWIRETKGENA